MFAIADIRNAQPKKVLFMGEGWFFFSRFVCLSEFISFRSLINSRVLFYLNTRTFRNSFIQVDKIAASEKEKNELGNGLLLYS